MAFPAWRKPLGPYRSFGIAIAEDRARRLDELRAHIAELGDAPVSKADVVRVGVDMALDLTPEEIILRMDK